VDCDLFVIRYGVQPYIFGEINKNAGMPERAINGTFLLTTTENFYKRIQELFACFVDENN
jgi:hypothetical protein